MESPSRRSVPAIRVGSPREYCLSRAFLSSPGPTGQTVDVRNIANTHHSGPRILVSAVHGERDVVAG